MEDDEDKERDDLIQKLRKEGFTWTDIAKFLCISTRTLKRWRQRTRFDEKPENLPIG